MYRCTTPGACGSTGGAALDSILLKQENSIHYGKRHYSWHIQHLLAKNKTTVVGRVCNVTAICL